MCNNKSGQNTLNFKKLSRNQILVFDGNSFVTGQPDWVNKSIATYGDSVTATNNGNFIRPYTNEQKEKWGNIVADYYGFAKHYGRGIGSQSFTWAFQNGELFLG